MENSTSNKKTAQMAAWSMRLLTISSRVAAFFATRFSRLLIILFFILLSLYIAYQQVWQPVVGTAPLPPGVTERSPKLNTELLQTINTQRLQRVEAPRERFDVEALFKPLVAL